MFPFYHLKLNLRKECRSRAQLLSLLWLGPLVWENCQWKWLGLLHPKAQEYNQFLVFSWNLLFPLLLWHSQPWDLHFRVVGLMEDHFLLHIFWLRFRTIRNQLRLVWFSRNHCSIFWWVRFCAGNMRKEWRWLSSLHKNFSYWGRCRTEWRRKWQSFHLRRLQTFYFKVFPRSSNEDDSSMLL